MFILQPDSNDAFDLDKFVAFLEADDDIVFVLSPDRLTVSFPLNPSQLRIQAGIAIVEAVDIYRVGQIVRWFVQSQGTPVRIMNDQDQISVRIRPDQTEINEDDIRRKDISTGTDARVFASSLQSALLPQDPWGMRPTTPKGIAASWLQQLTIDQPEIRGERDYAIAIRNIYVWSKRRRSLFQSSGGYEPVYWREESGSDVVAIFFKEISTLFDRCVEDEASDGSPRYLCRGELSIFDHPDRRNDLEHQRARLIEAGRNLVNAQDDEVAIDLDDGALTTRTNGGFWVKKFFWTNGNVVEEDVFIPSD